MPAATAGRRRLALPEADSIAALLGEVMGGAGPTPSAAPRPAADAPRGGRPADAPAGRFLASVNWANDPARASAAEALSAPAADTVGERWETGGYLNQFAWD